MSSSENEMYEDEREVELQDVTLKQDIVESEETPRLLLFVKHDKECERKINTSESENQNNQQLFQKLTNENYKEHLSVNVMNRTDKGILHCEQKERSTNVFETDLESRRAYSAAFSELTSKSCKGIKKGASKSLEIWPDNSFEDSFELGVSRISCIENANTFGFIQNDESDLIFCPDSAKATSENTSKIKNGNPNISNISSDEDIVNKLYKFKKVKNMRRRNKKESHVCEKCNRMFKKKSHLVTHSRAHVTERSLKCNECGVCFKTKSSLYFHMKRHTGAPFICKLCNKEYLERKQLMRHTRVVHMPVNLFPCSKCEKSFKTRQTYEFHSLFHKGEKRFLCDICQKRFVYKSTLLYHINSHQLEKEFKCDQCPKEYAVCAEFKRHYMNHTSNRPFQCDICGKSFPLKGTLKNHIKIHSLEKPFKCKFCDKSFMKKQSLICHTMVRNGESPKYLCDQCSKSYYNIFALKRHYIKHTEERKFICGICNKAFWMKDALKVHKRTHENKMQNACNK